MLTGVAAHASGHQQYRRTDSLAASLLNVVADRRDQRHLRLEMADEFALDLLQVAANRLEHLCEDGR